MSVYDLVHEDDHVNVKNALDEAEAKAMAGLTIKGLLLVILSKTTMLF